VPNQNKPLKNFAELFALGFQMLAIIGASTFLGLKLDAFYSNSATDSFTLGCTLIGVVLATAYVVRMILKRSNKPYNNP
jgi:hypothetical protein